MVYLYRHPETGEVKEIVQKMNDNHVFSENGVEWERIYIAPKISIDTKINPFSQKDFVENSKKKKGTVGDLWDAAKEASNKREQIMGKDPVKEKAYADYSKTRNGLKHINQIKESF